MAFDFPVWSCFKKESKHVPKLQKSYYKTGKRVPTIRHNVLLVRWGVHGQDKTNIDVPQAVNREEKCGSNFDLHVKKFVHNRVQFLRKNLSIS